MWFFELVFDIWPSGRDIQIFCWLKFRLLQEFVNCIFGFWLIISGQVDVLITYYWSIWSYNFCHCRLHANIIVGICSFQIMTYYLCPLVKDIIISIVRISVAYVLNEFKISSIWPYVSLIYVGYFCVYFKWIHAIIQRSAFNINFYKWFGICRNWFFPYFPFYTLFLLFDLRFISFY